jgi:RimJ/RimL family protein N-acetyltransferase
MSTLLPAPSLRDVLPVESPARGRAEHFAVRKLTASDSAAFKAIRLEALAHEGHLFGPTYEKESAIADEHWWRERCTETPESCMFGLFDKSNTLIGIMGVKSWEKDATGETAVWWTAFVRKAGYRGRGLAAQLYAEREAWTKARYQRVRILIRESNVRAIAIHEKHGAVHTQTELIDWPGRPTVPWRWYEKQLHP